MKPAGTTAASGTGNRFARIVRVAGAEDGQDLLEYGLLMALIAIAAMGAIGFLGDTVNTVFWQSIANNF
jgi:Flp pilus assembly pilin Flp